MSASLSVTHTKWQHKLDFPQADWPIVSFPRYRYPVESHVKENQAEEFKCLLEVPIADCSGRLVAGVSNVHVLSLLVFRSGCCLWCCTLYFLLSFLFLFSYLGEG